MRTGLVAVSVALLAASCGGGATAVRDDGATGATGPSVRIEIEDPPASADDSALVVTTPDGAPAASTGDGAAGASATAAQPSSDVAASGPASSVVAHATVLEIVARTEPAADGAEIVSLSNPTSSGSPLVFLVVDGDRSVPGWVEVQLPIQPNGTTGWVRRDQVELFAVPYRIEIDRAAHRLRVFEDGELWIETAVAIGTGDTPTPVGDFYLLELLAPPDPTGPYGPYAFGLSGFSEVLDSFGGVDSAIIGLHGTNDPSAIGTDVSFGCIRMTNDVIEQLAASVPLGTPVVIT